MTSKDIQEIFKELMQAYKDEYAHYDLNPIDMLKLHIAAFLKHEWKSKESAILDLALRHGIKVKEVEELVGKGTPRKEAIAKVSNGMRIEECRKDVLTPPSVAPLSVSKKRVGEKIRPLPRVKPVWEPIDNMVLNYIMAREGTISLSQAAQDLGLTLDELNESIKRLKKEHKIE